MTVFAEVLDQIVILLKLRSIDIENTTILNQCTGIAHKYKVKNIVETLYVIINATSKHSRA